MEPEIIRSTSGLHDWFQTPPGRYLLDWERAEFGRVVADLFGYHALQLGLPDVDTLATSRMSHCWLALDAAGHAALGGATAERLALLADHAALPFPAQSLDLVTLPHALELNADPHTTLREVERVLLPEGRVVIAGLNPASLWGLRQRRAMLFRRAGWGEPYLPEAGQFIGYWRLRDWLRLLGFEVEMARFGCYRAAVRTERWLQRLQWMDALGERWWPIFGAAYFMVAVKRVRGMRLLTPAWRPAPVLPVAPVSVANYHQPTLGTTEKTS